MLNDGDIRRALLKGKNLGSKIDSIYNKRPIIFRENSVRSKVIRRLSAQKVEHAPIVKNKKVIGIFSSKNYIRRSKHTSGHYVEDLVKD